MKAATGVCDGWGTHHSKTKIPIPTGWGVLEAILYGVWLSCVLKIVGCKITLGIIK